MIDINSVTYEQLNNVITDLGQPEFRTKQIFTWLHKNGVSSFDEMTNISKSLREKLSDNFYISTCQIEDKYISKIDGSRDAHFLESNGEKGKNYRFIEECNEQRRSLLYCRRP